jgi:hypothetical protein
LIKGFHHLQREIVGNIVVIDVKNRRRLQMPKINIARWRLLEILFLDFFYAYLDTLSLKDFLLQRPRSNGIIGYMVENLILIPFKWYIALPLSP